MVLAAEHRALRSPFRIPGVLMATACVDVFPSLPTMTVVIAILVSRIKSLTPG